MKKKLLLVLMVMILVGGSLFLAPEVSAKSCEGVETATIECGDSESGIGAILKLVINIMSVGIGILGVIGISVAGIQYLTAGGNEEQVRKSKRRIFEVVIGLAAYAVMGLTLTWLIPGEMDPEQLPHYDTPVGGGGSGGGGSITPTTRFDAKFSLENNSGLDYWINVPNNATNGMPLIVFLHGDGEMGDAEAVKSLPTAQYLAKNSRSYISIAPVGSGYNWSRDDKQQPLMALINHVSDEYQVDKSRIFLIGFSRGSAGTWDLVNSYPNYFAAAVPISGSPTRSNAANFKHTKIYAIVGGAEYDTMNNMRNFVDAINSNGGSAKFEVYPGLGHGNMQGALRHDEIIEWMFSVAPGSSSNPGSTPTVKYDEVNEKRKYTHPSTAWFDYILNVPKNATNGMPLVVYLHSDWQYNDPSSLWWIAPVDYMEKNNDSRGFIYIAPWTRVPDWVGNDDYQLTALKGLIDKTVEDYQIDKSRIYIFGLSRGAIGTWNMVDRYPDLFAAAAPVSCCWNGGGTRSPRAENFKHTKIYAISGDSGDQERGYSSCMQSYVNSINAAGGSAFKETYHGESHDTITYAIDYSKIFDWLLKQ